jgi:peroxiredoxin
MKRFLLLLFINAFAFSQGLKAQGYAIGDEAKDFDLPTVDGGRVSLSEGSKGAIVIFTCNTCPYAKAYEDRIISLHQNFTSKGFPVIAINSNDTSNNPGDSLEEMKARSESKNFPFPYARDESQEVIKTYGGTRTPHIYLLEKDGERYFIRYIGAIDNNYQDANAATEHYVEDAIAELLQGKKVSQSFTKAIGCTIKWKK